ncbi:MAG: glycosyltransferase [Bacteroidales bacterium]|nr:glycosyltransferase [Bacteroidales bacterium]
MKVLIRQEKITNYREPFFEKLSACNDINLMVAYNDLSLRDRKQAFRQSSKFRFTNVNLNTVIKPHPFLKIIIWEKPDVVVLGNFNFTEDLIIYIYCRLKNIPLLRWNGGFVPSTSESKNLRLFYKTLFHRIFRSYYPTKLLLLQCNNGFIVYSEAGKKFINESLKIRKKVFVAPNSPDTDNFVDIKSRILSNPGLLDRIKEKLLIEDCKVLLAVGRLNLEKKTEWLLDVFGIVQKSYARTSIIIIGEGESLPQLIDKVNKKGLNNVIFTGAVYDEVELGKYYCLSDLYITTSASLSVKSAMTYGIPVISMDNGLEVHAIENNINGFIVEYGNIEKMAEKILCLLNNEDLKKSIRENALKTINETCNISLMVEGFHSAVIHLKENKC